MAAEAEALQRDAASPSRQIDLRSIGVKAFPQQSFDKPDPWKSTIGESLRDGPSWMVGLASLAVGKPPWLRKPQKPNTVRVRPWLGLASGRGFLGIRGSF